MAKFLLVPGIHTTSKKGSMARLAKSLILSGHSVRQYPYPTRWGYQLFFSDIVKSDATGLLRFHKEDEIIISHSYGCLLAQEAFKMGLSCPQWFAFAGACTSDKVDYPKVAFNHAYIIFNPYDIAVKFGAMVPWYPVGKLGTQGYRGFSDGSYDTRIININGASDRWGLDHSHYWNEQLSSWVMFINENTKSPKSLDKVYL